MARTKTSTPHGTKQLAHAIVEILRDGLEIGQLPSGVTKLVIKAQLGPALYKSVNAVLETLGGAWNRKEKGHLFPTETMDDLRARLDLVVETGSYIDEKKALGFFQTPRAFADLLVQIVNPRPNERVLEPSAGAGVFVEAVRSHVIGARIAAVEIHEGRAHALARAQPEVTVVHDDFLQYLPPALFDVVVGNPPYAKRAAIHHVDKALALLSRRPAGRLAMIVPAGLRTDTTAAAVVLRTTLLERGHAFVPNPEDLFALEGTKVRTETLLVGLSGVAVAEADRVIRAFRA